MLRAIGLIVAVSMCVGCAMPEPKPVLNTPSGSPEVLIPGATVAQVWPLLTDEMETAGYQTETLTDYQAIFLKDAPAMVSAFVGKTWYLVVFTPRATATGLRIKGVTKTRYADSDLGTKTDKPGGNPKVESQVQSILERIRAALGDRAPSAQ